MLAESVIELHWLDWLVIGLYGAAMFGIAIWAFRKINDCGGFLLGKRKMGKLMMMATTFAGGTNANHPMGVSAATYKEGLSGMWLSLTWMLITPFFWMYPPVLRRLRIVTMVDLVRHRFGRLMAGIFKFVAIVGTPISIGFGIKSAAIVVEVMTGGAIGGMPAMLVVIVPTIIYSLLGGVIAAYATDVMQGLLIIVLSFLMIPFAIDQAGGVQQLNEGISNELTHLIAKEGGQGFGFWWIFWFMIGILFSAPISTGGGASAARNEFAARSQIFGLVFKRFCTIGWGFIGLFAIALYAGKADAVANPDDIFPTAAGDLLPVVLRGLMVASMLAAVMSSLDGMMINFSGMMVNNLWREYIVTKGTPKHYFRAARIFAVLGVLAGWFVAEQVNSIVQFAKLMEPFNSLTGVAILVALMWRRTTKWGAIASVAVMFPLFFWTHKDLGADGLMSLPIGIRHLGQWMIDGYGMIGHTVYMKEAGDAIHLPVDVQIPLYLLPGLATLIVVSLLTKQHDQKKVDEFYARLDTPVGDEHKLREMGYLEDDLEGLDGEVITVEERDRDVSKRLLLPDLLRLPKLLIKGEAKLSDYKVDLIGLVASIAFVVLFIMFIEWLGSFFR